MKKFTWLLAAALPVVLFFSCQKEVATSAANRSVAMTPGGPPEDPGGGCSKTVPGGFVQVSYPNGAPVAGQSTVVRVCVPCGSMTSADIMLNGQSVGTASANPGASCLDITFTPAASNDCSNPANVYSLDIAYNNSGGATCDAEDFPEAPYCNKEVKEQAAAFCIPILPAECDPANPLTLTGTVNSITTDPGDATRSIIDVTYCVTSCENISGVRVQGGATAGGNLGAALISWDNQGLVTTGPIVYPNITENNIVLSWTTDLTKGVTKCFNFKYSRSLVPECGTITGQWSAKSAGVTDAIVAPLDDCPE